MKYGLWSVEWWLNDKFAKVNATAESMDYIIAMKCRNGHQIWILHNMDRLIQQLLKMGIRQEI